MNVAVMFYFWKVPFLRQVLFMWFMYNAKRQQAKNTLTESNVSDTTVGILKERERESGKQTLRPCRNSRL
jgi:uncharacterized membrane protein